MGTPIFCGKYRSICGQTWVPYHDSQSAPFWVDITLSNHSFTQCNWTKRKRSILEKKLSIRVPRYNIYISITYIYICDRWFMLNNLGVLATRETIDPRIPTVSTHIQWAPAAKKLLSKPGCGWVTRENRRHNQPPLTNKEPTILNKDWDDWICLGCNTDTKIWKLQRKYYIRKLCIEIWGLGSNPNYITFESLVKPPLLIAGLPAAGWH